MGTRSDIIVELRNGSWARIYCHWDGYLEHNGHILATHYADQIKAEKLVALGDLSALAAKLGKPKGHTFNALAGINAPKPNVKAFGGNLVIGTRK